MKRQVQGLAVCVMLFVIGCVIAGFGWVKIGPVKPSESLPTGLSLERHEQGMPIERLEDERTEELRQAYSTGYNNGIMSGLQQVLMIRRGTNADEVIKWAEQQKEQDWRAFTSR